MSVLCLFFSVSICKQLYDLKRKLCPLFNLSWIQSCLPLFFQFQLIVFSILSPLFLSCKHMKIFGHRWWKKEKTKFFKKQTESTRLWNLMIPSWNKKSFKKLWWSTTQKEKKHKATDPRLVTFKLLKQLFEISSIWLM